MRNGNIGKVAININIQSDICADVQYIDKTVGNVFFMDSKFEIHLRFTNYGFLSQIHSYAISYRIGKIAIFKRKLITLSK